ncbi:F-actin-capping protein subunit alpha [Histomonas meleagridis]|uniref:F-actin-capping protein subunit alpha n=1 Tax=Histomonas meleagridis TaxID=135588 RepID=UPI0035598CD2|nr:F-actin-capping protein subunit alpha [Histomonas meleagridis]KAH0802980.1 F-actin-capping protein subunit alpha [Histomonas meleagridis]
MEADPKLVEAASRLLVNAPPGEFEDCVNAMNQFVDDKAVVEEARKQSVRKWMMSRCVAVEVGNHSAMVCEEALQDGSRFVDPHTMKIFKYNFEDRTSQETDEQLESTPFRNACQTALDVFSKNTLKNGACGVYDTNNGVAIVLSGSSIARENYRTGDVFMRFTIENGHLQGKITAAAHFYENGNCTLENSADFEAQVSGNDNDSMAAAAVKKLSEFYKTWTEKLAYGFDLLKDEGLNRLRRRLPVTKSKVNWRAEIVGSASMGTKKK